MQSTAISSCKRSQTGKMRCKLVGRYMISPQMASFYVHWVQNPSKQGTTLKFKRKTFASKGEYLVFQCWPQLGSRVDQNGRGTSLNSFIHINVLEIISKVENILTLQTHNFESTLNKSWFNVINIIMMIKLDSML